MYMSKLFCIELLYQDLKTVVIFVNRKILYSKIDGVTTDRSIDIGYLGFFFIICILTQKCEKKQLKVMLFSKY